MKKYTKKRMNRNKTEVYNNDTGEWILLASLILSEQQKCDSLTLESNSSTDYSSGSSYSGGSSDYSSGSSYSSDSGSSFSSDSSSGGGSFD